MYNVVLLILSAVFKSVESQTFSFVGNIVEGQPVTIRCQTADFLDAISFERNTVNQGGCLAGAGGLCLTGVTGYQTPTRQGTTVTQMIITSYTQSRDGGSWTCTYGTTLRSPAVILQLSSSDQTCQKGDGCLILTIVGITAVALIVLIVICIILCKRYFLIVQQEPLRKIMDGKQITKQGDNPISGLPFSFTWKKHKDHVTLLENLKLEEETRNQDAQWRVFKGTETNRVDIPWSLVDFTKTDKYSMKGFYLTIFKPTADDEGFYEATINARKIGIFLGLMIHNFKKKIFVSAIALVVAVVLAGIILGAVSGKLRDDKVSNFCCEVGVIATAVPLSIVGALALSGLLLFLFLWKVYGMDFLKRSWKFNYITSDE